MKLLAKTARLFTVPVLTKGRIWFAFAVAGATDAIQVATGPLSWVFVDQALDVLAMGLTIGAIGFHPLLLPTFVVEALPLTDMLPTWTACTAAVVVLRKRAQAKPPPMPPSAIDLPPAAAAKELPKVGGTNLPPPLMP